MSKVKIARKEWNALKQASNTLTRVANNAQDMAEVGTLLNRIRNDFDLMEADSDYPFLAGFAAETVANSLDRMTQALVHATGAFHEVLHLTEELSDAERGAA